MKPISLVISVLVLSACASGNRPDDLETGDKMEVSRNSDREGIRRVIRDNIDDIRECYQVELEENPSIEGKIVVEWTYNRTGKVIAAGVDEDSTTLFNQNVGKCLVAKIRTLSFPPVEKWENVSVLFPFYFRNK